MKASESDLASAAEIEGRIESILAEATNPDDRAAVESNGGAYREALARIIASIDEDLAAFAASDPAAGGRPEVIFRAYSSFDAVVHYRLAHALLTLPGGSPGLRAVVSRRIAERGKVRSGVDIHPAAEIGRRFILDHAYGTVIGETCEIGDDCYVLGGVTLGARGIARNALGKRHPTIGDRVQIGAFAKVLGPVHVGDDVFISPNSVITWDIPSSARVSIVNQMQLQHGSTSSRELKVYGVGVRDGSLYVLGAGLSRLSAAVVDDHFQPVPDVPLDVRLIDETVLRIQLDPARLARGKRFHLRLRDQDAEVVLIEPRGLRDLLDAAPAAWSARDENHRAEC